MTALSVFMR